MVKKQFTRHILVTDLIFCYRMTGHRFLQSRNCLLVKMSVNIDMESFSATKNLRRRTFNTIKSAVTALKQITSKCSIVLEVFFYLNFLSLLRRHSVIYFLITRSFQNCLATSDLSGYQKANECSTGSLVNH